MRSYSLESPTGAGTRLLHSAFALLLTLLLAGCSGDEFLQQSMANQPRCEPYEQTAFFDDDACARAPIPNTVARQSLDTGQLFEEGMVPAQQTDVLPIAVTGELLARGQERYDIYCAPCHGIAGYGDGAIVQRGFPPPPSLHEQRLRDVPDSYLYDVITNGVGVMYPYGSRVQPEDRWAIIGYIRALQLSQNAPADLLDPDELSMEPNTVPTTEDAP